MSWSGALTVLWLQCGMPGSAPEQDDATRSDDKR